MRIRHLFGLLGLLVASGCSTDMEQVTAESPIPFAFNTPLEIQDGTTRATDGLNNAFTTGDVIRLYAKYQDADWVAYDYKLSSAGTWQPVGNTCYYPLGDQTMQVKAVYPATIGEGEVDISTNQSTDEVYKKNDIMYVSPITLSKPTTNPTPNVSLHFKHKMTKVIVNVTSKSSDVTITSVSLINIRSHCSVRDLLELWDGGTLNDNLMTGSKEVAINQLSGVQSMSCTAVILPQQTHGWFITVITNVGYVYFSFVGENSQMYLHSGKEYKFELSVSRATANSNQRLYNWTENQTGASSGITEYIARVPLNAISSTTTGMVGKIIATDGYVYDLVSDANRLSTAVAVIAYVGDKAWSAYPHGLAISLTPQSRVTYSSAESVINGMNRLSSSNKPSQTSNWMIPSLNQLKLIHEACGGTAYSEGTSNLSSTPGVLPAILKELSISSDYLGEVAWWTCTDGTDTQSRRYAYFCPSRSFMAMRVDGQFPFLPIFAF